MKIFSFFAMAASAAAMLAYSTADAQTTTSNSNAGAISGSTSTAGSTSGSLSGASTGPATAVTGGSNASWTTTSNVQNPNDITIRSAPQVFAPSVSGGNPCTVGASVGASFIGVGGALGGTWVDEDCAKRQDAALLHNTGYKDAAREIQCDKRAIYDAMKRAGTPCVFRAAWEPPGTPPTAQPLPSPVTAPIVPSFNAAQFPDATSCLNASNGPSDAVSAANRSACQTFFASQRQIAGVRTAAAVGR